MPSPLPPTGSQHAPALLFLWEMWTHSLHALLCFDADFVVLAGCEPLVTSVCLREVFTDRVIFEGIINYNGKTLDEVRQGATLGHEREGRGRRRRQKASRRDRWATAWYNKYGGWRSHGLSMPEMADVSSHDSHLVRLC